jgi:hypothetical protein
LAAALMVLAALLSGCGSGEPAASPTPEGSVEPAAGTEGAGGWFESLPDTGLEFVHFNGMFGALYFPEMFPPGVGVLDYDNDGDLDVYAVQSGMLVEGKSPSEAGIPPTALPLKGRLFRNDLEVHADGTRTLRFVDVTEASGILADRYGMGVAAGDVDNDGCVDIYLTHFGPNQLFRNNCDGTFTDVSRQSGTDDPGWGVSASFVDYDRDGWLDLYVGNYVVYDTKNDQPCKVLTGKRDYCTPSVYQPQPDKLYRNRGDGTFADVSGSALGTAPFGPALGVSTADFNNDGWLDIYVANDMRENLLWMNQRNGTFRNVGLISGSALSADGKAEASMGVDAGDFDGDGDEDLFMTHLPTEGNNLYVNDGSGTFDDRSSASGLGPMSLGYSGFGTAWVDVDNDGWLDLLAVNGSISAIEGQEGPFPYAERKLLFRNLGDGRFADVTAEAGPAFQVPEVSRGAAFGDIDNDGDTDVVIGNLNGPVRILLNTIGNRHHRVCLRLVGARTPRDMLGARVEVLREGSPPLVRRVRSDGSYASVNDPRVLVGLGASADPPAVRVRWPDGRTEQWPEVPVDQCTTLRQGTGRSGA